MRPSSSTIAAPVASSESTVVFTISRSDSSMYRDSDTASEIRDSASSSRTRCCAAS
jgi:hypothetical protein